MKSIVRIVVVAVGLGFVLNGLTTPAMADQPWTEWHNALAPQDVKIKFAAGKKVSLFDTKAAGWKDAPLADGVLALAIGTSWYLHVRTRDVAGNWAATAAHYGPFYIDTLAPTNPTSVTELRAYKVP